MCCALILELGVLISEQQKVAGKGDRVTEWVTECRSGDVSEWWCDGAEV